MSSRRRLEAAAEMQPDWLWLPEEILYLIMGNLIVSSPSNLYRFSSVCNRWHRLFSDSLPKLVLEHRITPLALAPVFDLDEAGSMKHNSWRIYNLTGESVLSPVNSLPLWPNRIIGSSFGWIIVADSTKQSVSLYNPLLLSNSCIRLPPFLFPWNHRTDLVKAVLSNSPQQDGHFDIAVTLGVFYVGNCETASRIAFLHVEKIEELESLQWMHYHHNASLSDGILDVNSIGGRICVLDTRGIIRCCRCSSDDGFEYYNAVSSDYLPRTKDFIRNGVAANRDAHGTAYLLESSSISEPLVVFRTNTCLKSSSCLVSSSTKGFKVFALTSSSGNEDDDEINELKKTWNWTEEKKMEMHQKQQHHVLKWSMINEINDVIFLEERASICMNIDDTPKLQKLQPGCIYFLERLHHQATEFRIFNIEKNSITNFDHRNNNTEIVRGQPIWIHPC